MDDDMLFFRMNIEIGNLFDWVLVFSLKFQVLQVSTQGRIQQLKLKVELSTRS